MPLNESHAAGETITAADMNALAALANDLDADALRTAAAPELIRDTIGTALVAGSNVTITPNDGSDTITIAATGGAALLGSVFYRPASPDRHTTSSTSFSDMDATNLAVTFTATTTTVMVDLIGFVFKDTGTTNGAQYHWNLRDSGGDIADTNQVVSYSNSTALAWRTATSVRVAGLTVGNSYTFKWGHKVSADTFGILHSTTWGDAVMRVWAA